MNLICRKCMYWWVDFEEENTDNNNNENENENENDNENDNDEDINNNKSPFISSINIRLKTKDSLVKKF